MELTGKYAASNFFMKQGIEIDFKNNCYSKFSRLFSFIKFKEACKVLPKPDYVLLFRTLYIKCETCTEDDFNNSSIIQLSLVYHKNRKLIVHESKNAEEIKNMAKLLADRLNLGIKDSATDRRNPKWIN